MDLQISERFREEYHDLPPKLQALVSRKLRYPAESLRHRSLRVKRVQGTTDLYEASVNMRHRIIFRIVPGAYRLLRIGTHGVFNEL